MHSLMRQLATRGKAHSISRHTVHHEIRRALHHECLSLSALLPPCGLTVSTPLRCAAGTRFRCVNEYTIGSPFGEKPNTMPFPVLFCGRHQCLHLFALHSGAEDVMKLTASLYFAASSSTSSICSVLRQTSVFSRRAIACARLPLVAGWGVSDAVARGVRRRTCEISDKRLP